MSLGGVWEILWEELNSKFTGWASDLRACNRRMYWFAEHHETETFPFGAVAGFGKAGIPGDSDIVLSFSVQQTDEGYIVTSDIATGEGLLIVQTGDIFLSKGQPDVQMLADLVKCKDAFERIVEASFSDIRNTICR